MVASAALLGLGLGCTLTPARLDLSVAPSGCVFSNPFPDPGHRPVLLAPVEDLRLEKAFLGEVGGRPFCVTSLDAWVARGLQSLAGHRFHLVSQGAPAGVPVLHVRILKAYLSSISTSKCATLILQAEVTRTDGSSKTFMVRGQTTRPNWSSGEAETLEALQATLEKCKVELSGRVDAALD